MRSTKKKKYFKRAIKIFYSKKKDYLLFKIRLVTYNIITLEISIKINIDYVTAIRKALKREPVSRMCMPPQEARRWRMPQQPNQEGLGVNIKLIFPWLSPKFALVILIGWQRVTASECLTSAAHHVSSPYPYPWLPSR